MPEVNNIRARPLPGYLKHITPMLLVLVCWVALNAFLLIRDLEREHSPKPHSVVHISVFEKPNGEVVLCPSAGGREFDSARVPGMGAFEKCSFSNKVTKIVHGAHGTCSSFADRTSAERFLGCIATPGFLELNAVKTATAHAPIELSREEAC